MRAQLETGACCRHDGRTDACCMHGGGTGAGVAGVWPSNGGQGRTVRHTGGRCGQDDHKRRGGRVHDHGDMYI